MQVRSGKLAGQLFSTFGIEPLWIGSRLKESNPPSAAQSPSSGSVRMHEPVAPPSESASGTAPVSSRPASSRSGISGPLKDAGMRRAILPANEGVSSHHCDIVHTQGAYSLVDARSHSGTFLRLSHPHRRSVPFSLKVGDVWVSGKSVLEVSRAAEIGAFEEHWSGIALKCTRLKRAGELPKFIRLTGSPFLIGRSSQCQVKMFFW